MSNLLTDIEDGLRHLWAALEADNHHLAERAKELYHKVVKVNEDVAAQVAPVAEKAVADAAETVLSAGVKAVETEVK